MIRHKDIFNTLCGFLTVFSLILFFATKGLTQSATSTVENTVKDLKTSQRVETNSVIATFKQKATTGDVFKQLDKIRPQFATEDEKRYLMSQLLTQQLKEVEIVRSEKKNDSLRNKLTAALSLHKHQDMNLVIFKHKQPIVMTKIGVVIAFATGFLAISDEDAALVGVTAHELGHEYFALLSGKALASNDLAQARKIELACDAIAVATLIELQLPTEPYKNLLKKVHNHSFEASRLNNGTNSHPAWEEEAFLIDELTKHWSLPKTVAGNQ